MANKWFETVAVAQRRAKKRLPKSVYGALIAGAEAGVTIRDNVNAFSELGFAPHVAGLPATREMATTVMGQPISLPVLISPTGVQAVHPDGEVAVARAAAARGTAMGLSSFASKPIEEVIAANRQTFFQMYWVGNPDDMAARMARARAAAALATATSPSGCTACTPVGEISTGSEIGWPITVVAISRVAGSPATCGASPISANASTLSRMVTPASAPSISAP